VSLESTVRLDKAASPEDRKVSKALPNELIKALCDGNEETWVKNAIERKIFDYKQYLDAKDLEEDPVWVERLKKYGNTGTELSRRNSEKSIQYLPQSKGLWRHFAEISKSGYLYAVYVWYESS
jgi:hypothetical protein